MDDGSERRGVGAFRQSGWARFCAPAGIGALTLALGGAAVALAASSPVELGTYKGTSSQHTSVELVVVTSGAEGCTGLCVATASNTGIYMTLKCKASPGAQPVTASVPFQTYGAKIKPNLTVLVKETAKKPTYAAPNWTVSMSFTRHGTVAGRLTAKGDYTGGGPSIPCSGRETFTAKLARR